MDLNDPVDEDAAHSFRDVGLVLHVTEFGLVARLSAEVMLHNVFGELGHTLWVRSILLVAWFNDILEIILASLFEYLICDFQPIGEGLLGVYLREIAAFNQLDFLLFQN